MSHCSSSSLFFPFHPHRLTHSCFSSSQIAFSFFLCEIPFSFANFSHFVKGFGLGNGLARGSCVIGGGSAATGPFEDGVEGREKSALRRAWTPSRALDWRYVSRSSLQSIENIGVGTLGDHPEGHTCNTRDPLGWGPLQSTNQRRSQREFLSRLRLIFCRGWCHSSAIEREREKV